MRIAVLSGKGGTGKTFIAVNLATVASSALYLDCDVEAPNGHLFFKAKEHRTESVAQWIPKVDHTLCKGCRACVEFCEFNALAYFKSQVQVFDSVCHACGGCSLVCPNGAIQEISREIGQVIYSNVEQELPIVDINIVTGKLAIGEVTGVPIIKQVLSVIEGSDQKTVVIDCPPGSSCSVMESIQGADYCLLIAEPTQFGAHNLALVHELVTLFDKPHGIVLNKCTGGVNPSEHYANEKGIEIIARFDYTLELAQLNGSGHIISLTDLNMREAFQRLLKVIEERGLTHEAALDS